MTPQLRRLAAGLRRWIGFGPAPAIGVSYDDRFLAVALVDQDQRRVRGVGIVEFDPGTVVSGKIERPLELASALNAALASIRPPAAGSAGVCLPLGLDHQGSHWPAEATSPDGKPEGVEIVSALRSAGFAVRTAAPIAVVGARLGSLAASQGGSGHQQDPVSVIVRSGWLNAMVNTAKQSIDCRTESSDSFRTPPDVRLGVASERAGTEVDPFSWPKQLRDRRQAAMLAAGAAMMA